MILTNPGGPGDSGVAAALGLGKELSAAFGTSYDFVGFDPRGVGYSLPSGICVGSGASPQKRRSIETIPVGRGPEIPELFLEAAYQNATVNGEICQEQIGGPNDAGPHMTTSVNAKDMISILDAFAASPEAVGVENATDLNYWGFSYGTFLGQTFASMFPDRVGRMVIDAVVDPEDYILMQDEKMIQFSDETFSTFFIYCFLAGDACPYFTGSSPYDVYLRFADTVSKLDVDHAFSHGWQNATDLYLLLEDVKLTLFEGIYSAIENFPTMAQTLVMVEQALKNLTSASLGTFETYVNSYLPIVGQSPAIFCTDGGNLLFNSTLKDMSFITASLKSQTWVSGEILSVTRIDCAGWSIKGTERYAGPFGGDTKNPMLFVSNTRDPVTPVYNGQKWSHRFKGAQLLTVDGTGHTSPITKNTCAFQKIGNYFKTGELPGNDNFCKLEVGPWNVTIPQGMENVNGWRDIQDGLASLRAPAPCRSRY
ncbi:alpha/beta-hydrolase [Mollisia scopiformis]|uniref:Alpha/beta-hydrolase n=1 Tax=Mollisia scopiformis TaxID=149040 RepID=A0A132B6M0_MOLSC|nr:alpha/beta-hydrolase [Mollisia scopiformis]KUJ07981.1 alpha/beta-hydrolase [Mollisia scopiformis]